MVGGGHVQPADSRSGAVLQLRIGASDLRVAGKEPHRRLESGRCLYGPGVEPQLNLFAATAARCFEDTPFLLSAESLAPGNVPVLQLLQMAATFSPGYSLDGDLKKRTWW